MLVTVVKNSLKKLILKITLLIFKNHGASTTIHEEQTVNKSL